VKTTEENGTTDPGKAWLDGDLDRLITAGLLQPTTEFSVPMQRYISAEEQADHLIFDVYAVPGQ